MRRSLAAALWLLAGVMASGLGGLAALVGTPPGRALLARVATATLGTLVDGSVEIAAVSGPLITGVTLRGVRIFDRQKNLVAALPVVDATYDPFDFVAHRFVLLAVRVEHPVLDLVQHPRGDLNLADVLRLGGGGGTGPAPLIALRNVDLEDATVSLRLWEPGRSPGAEGDLRLHEFEHLNARLPLVRLAGPGAPGVRIEIARVSFVSSDPRLDVRQAAGHLRVAGDSVIGALSAVELPRSRLALQGSVVLDGRGPLFDVGIEADSFRLGDAGFLLPRLPPNAVCRGTGRLESRGPRLLEVRLDPVHVRYAGGTLAGRLGILSASDSGVVALLGVDVRADDMDLDLPRGLLDTLPFAGWLSGRTVADGPLDNVAASIDWQFSDSLVPGTPRSQVRGQGRLDVRAPDGPRVAPFAVQAAVISLATVRRLVPSVVLQGALRLSGSVSGTLHDARFAGTLVHEDGARPASTVVGTIALDTRTDTLAITADVRADSLSFDGLRGSFPGLPLQGAVAGAIRLRGSPAALDTRLDLVSPGGALVAGGVLTVLSSRVGIRDLTLESRDLDLHRWIRGAPSSRLNASLQGLLEADSGAAPVGALAASLAPSALAGAPFDSGRADARFVGGRVYVDSLRISQPGLVTTAAGALGWRRPESGVLSVDLDADSLNALDSLLAWLAGPDFAAAAGGAGSRSLRGIGPRGAGDRGGPRLTRVRRARQHGAACVAQRRDSERPGSRGLPTGPGVRVPGRCHRRLHDGWQIRVR